MKIMVTGVAGQLGQAIIRRLKELGIQHMGVDRADFDLLDANAVEKAILEYTPGGVIHCAAYTAVDQAETERELCRSINVQGSVNVANACKAAGAKMLYTSTDYVFDGCGDQPFETDHPLAPVNYYGMTKAMGEDEVKSILDQYFIVRISWLFGLQGNNFVKTMLRLGQEKESVRVVADQYGSPTYAEDLAVLMCEMIQTDRYGVYHATNEGVCSWHAFATEIMRLAGLPCRVKAISSAEYQAKAKRPNNSRLSKRSLIEAGFNRLPDWQDALKRYLQSFGQEIHS